MDIKLLTKEQDTVRFVLSDVSPAFANALRRIILAEVPVMAIEDVMILENSSVMYDEILAHRLGLIPITTDQSYNLPEECTCKYDPKAKNFNVPVEASGTLPPEKLVLDAARLISAKTLGFEEGLGGISEK